MTIGIGGRKHEAHKAHAKITKKNDAQSASLSAGVLRAAFVSLVSESQRGPDNSLHHGRA
jgi:hypothetical protein